jgi:hypothetical protein
MRRIVTTLTIVTTLAAIGCTPEDSVVEAMHDWNSSSALDDVGHVQPTAIRATDESIASLHAEAGDRTIAGDSITGDSVVGETNVQLPHPERDDPFRYVGESLAQTTMSGEVDSKLPAVKVFGFAERHGVKAILQIAGKHYTVAQGQAAGPLTIARIDPPLVTVQMDNLSWTVSMFDKSRP